MKVLYTDLFADFWTHWGSWDEWGVCHSNGTQTRIRTCEWDSTCSSDNPDIHTEFDSRQCTGNCPTYDFDFEYSMEYYACLICSVLTIANIKLKL